MTTLRSRSSRAELAAELRHFCEHAHPHAAILAERKLAEEYGISHSTVRRVLAELQEDGLIYKVQGRGNFVAAAPPRAIAADQGVIVYGDSWKDPANRYRNQIVHGLVTAADTRNLRLEITIVDYHLEEGEAFWETVDRPEVRGLIVPWMPPKLYARLQRRRGNLAVVATASSHPPAGVAAVGVDYLDMGRQGALDLRELGGARPVAVCRVPHSAAGYRLGVEEFGGTPALIPGEHHADPAETAARLLAADPTGVFFDDDVRAGAILEHCDAAAPGFSDGIHIVTHANVGNFELPAHATRLEIDGFTVGGLLVNVIDGIVSDTLSAQGSYAVRPVRIPPRT
jgi:DNA-binding LacI/PurR family transcriptional regulator